MRHLLILLAALSVSVGIACAGSPTSAEAQAMSCNATIAANHQITGSCVVLAAAVTYPDGSSGAPSGTAQFPSALAGYAHRPPWKVAGMDYKVSTGTCGSVLTPEGNPGSVPSGASLDSTHKDVDVTGSNVTLNCWDFTGSGGWEVFDTGSNLTVTNSLFKSGSAANPAIFANGASNGGTFSNNTFDGNGVSNSTGALVAIANSTGTFTLQYDYFTNSPSDLVDVFGNTAGTLVMKYDLLMNTGGGAGAHPDWVQVFPGVIGGAGVSAWAVDEEFNTAYMTKPMVTTQGFTNGDNSFYGNLTTVKQDNNTLVLPIVHTPNPGSPGSDYGVNTAFIDEMSEISVSAEIENNYIDPSYIWNGWIAVGNHHYGPNNTVATVSGNVNMNTGTACTTSAC